MNQRNSGRTPFSCKFTVQNGYRVSGRAIDLSTNGMGFYTENHLEVGSRVYLIFQNDTFLVESSVRYCTKDPTEEEFRSGVRFITDARYIMPVLLMLENS